MNDLLQRLSHYRITLTVMIGVMVAVSLLIIFTHATSASQSSMLRGQPTMCAANETLICPPCAVDENGQPMGNCSCTCRPQRPHRIQPPHNRDIPMCTMGMRQCPDGVWVGCPNDCSGHEGPAQCSGPNCPGDIRAVSETTDNAVTTDLSGHRTVPNTSGESAGKDLQSGSDLLQLSPVKEIGRRVTSEFNGVPQERVTNYIDQSKKESLAQTTRPAPHIKDTSDEAHLHRLRDRVERLFFLVFGRPATPQEAVWWRNRIQMNDKDELGELTGAMQWHHQYGAALYYRVTR